MAIYNQKSDMIPIIIEPITVNIIDIGNISKTYRNMILSLKMNAFIELFTMKKNTLIPIAECGSTISAKSGLRTTPPVIGTTMKKTNKKLLDYKPGTS